MVLNLSTTKHHSFFWVFNNFFYMNSHNFKSIQNHVFSFHFYFLVEKWQCNAVSSIAADCSKLKQFKILLHPQPLSFLRPISKPLPTHTSLKQSDGMHGSNKYRLSLSQPGNKNPSNENFPATRVRLIMQNTSTH